MLRVCLLLLCAVGCLANFPPPGFPKPIPRVTIDLDKPPAERWYDAVVALVHQHGFNYTYGRVVEYWEKEIPSLLRPLVLELSTSLEKHLPKEYVDEIRGVAKAAVDLGYGDVLPLSKIVALNLLYELTSECTSIVSVDLQGNTWHSRNMDWSFSGYSFSNITVIADMTRKGKVEYSILGWAGYVGILTGMRYGAFGVTIDERFKLDIFTIIENIRHLSQGAATVSFLPRLAMDNQSSYQEALTALSTMPITSPVYYILSGAGKGEGSVMARAWNFTDHGVWSIPNGPKPWYILETNYDHWILPVPGDDRRFVAEDAMNKMGQAGISVKNLFKVMSTPATSWSRGVLNTETQYTVIMSPTTGHFEGWVWQ